MISSTEDDAQVQDVPIEERIVHPGYKTTEVYNDIALFRLRREAEITPWVAPVCLYTLREIAVPRANVTGWGRVDYGNINDSY